MLKVQPVILCGGSGTRLWPLSRAGFPKQFLCLKGTDSLFQQATQRLLSLGKTTFAIDPPFIVTGEDHRFLVAEQLREAGISQSAVFLEPVGRNTAPALTLAALAALNNDADPVLVVTPADQTVGDFTAFKVATQMAIEKAAEGCIVVLGVTPDRPETGYGYIQVKSNFIPAVNKASIQAVQRFVEKPDTLTAQQYLTEGGYFWNAGIFVLKASVWLKALQQFRLDIYQATVQAWNQRYEDAILGTNFVRPGQTEFTDIPAESVDYAVMERCPDSDFPIYMVPLDAGWNDLGAWDAVWNVMPKDDCGNAHVGDVLTTKSQNTMVHASSRLVSLVGVRDLIVVETPDAVLVADKTHSQDVKHIVNQLQVLKREEHNLHRKVHRPWGWYDSIDQGDSFKVKRIMVKPGASLSLQKHHHRAEHWIVVKGTAEITNGDKLMLLTENQSTYIPLGAVHRLSNPSNSPLEIIEVQSGTYLGEDDIIRFADTYGRTGA
jgi:mannose-1-phosphate guanylyltransferase/mannose-6-phosphate isomerase